MRRRKCKMCGKEFQGQGEQRLCPDCRSEAKRATVVLPRTCQLCERVFQGGPRARYCPECRVERKKKQSVEHMQRKAVNKTRKIGSIDICQTCGKEYTVRGGLQKYCPDCAQEAIRKNVLSSKRARAAERMKEITERKKKLLQESAVCAYCGKTYTPTSSSVTCSSECEREYRRITHGMAAYRAGKRKNPPSHERYSSGLPQSDLAGVTYNRRLGKWEVKQGGKYFGVFPTKEAAEEAMIGLKKQKEDLD